MNTTATTNNKHHHHHQQTLKRIYPGVRGRLVDLCKPTQRKFNVAVTTAAGRVSI